MANGSEPQNDEYLKSQSEFISENSKRIEQFLFSLPQINVQQSVEEVQKNQLYSSLKVGFSLYFMHRTIVENREELVRIDPNAKHIIEALVDDVGYPPEFEHNSPQCHSVFSILKRKLKKTLNK